MPSSIRVWVEPAGEWSQPFEGLDKVYIIHQALLFECRNLYIEEREWVAILPDLEIDAREITVTDNEFGSYLDLDESRHDFIRPGEVEKRNGIEIASARILKLRAVTFEKMAKANPHLYPVYKTIFKAAEVSDPDRKGYCLLFKFEDR